MMVSFMARQEMGRFAGLGKMAERQCPVAWKKSLHPEASNFDAGMKGQSEGRH
jgi:hypothetical protein